jgi:hypothetical protein
MGTSAGLPSTGKGSQELKAIELIEIARVETTRSQAPRSSITSISARLS